MPIINKPRTGSSQNMILLALLLAAPAAATQLGTPPVVVGAVPTAQPTPHAPSPAAVQQIDPRARDAWLRECRRRMGYAYEYADQAAVKRKKRKDSEPPRESGYDYCEAYFDDYYRSYQQQTAVPKAATPAPVQQPSQTVRETVTETYVPVRRRAIPKQVRPVRKPAGR